MALILTDEQKVKLTAGFFTKAGNVAQVDGAPVWTSSDPTIVAVVADAGGFSAYAITSGPLGTVQVSVTADADLGEGVRSVTGIIDIEVRPAEAVTAGIAAAVPEAKE
jgi:hypothetical protein